MTAALVLLAGLSLVLAGGWAVERRRRRDVERSTRARPPDPTEDAPTDPDDRAPGDPFVAGAFDAVTHELRSPLAAILGYQELLADGAYGDLGDDAREPVVRIGRSARHLLHLIDGALELDRLRNGTATAQLADVDLDTLVDTAADSFQRQARERGLRASVHRDETLPTIHTDPGRVARALDLLVTSAIKHPATKDLALHVTPRPDGATLRITGTYVPLRPDARDPGLGTGLHLAVVEATARFLHGRFTLHPLDDGSHDIELTLRSRPDSPSPTGG